MENVLRESQPFHLMLQAHRMAAVVSFIWYSNLGKLNIKEVFVQARKSTAKKNK